MNELVQNMLQLAQADLSATRKFESVEMGLLLTEVVDEFGGQSLTRGQSLRFAPLSAPVFVNGDVLQLKQLFRNLVGNAIKYTQRDGNIQVSMQAVDGALNVQVQDDGYGIPSADLPFIFDRFYRVRREGNEVEGNGLGLAIVKSIVEQHNGQVSVESEPQQGSCFSVRLPLPSTKTEVDGSASVTDKSYPKI
jgi:signal transduction histidine kinase